MDKITNDRSFRIFVVQGFPNVNPVLHWEVPLLSSCVSSKSECSAPCGSCLQESKIETRSVKV